MKDAHLRNWAADTIQGLHGELSEARRELDLARDVIHAARELRRNRGFSDWLDSDSHQRLYAALERYDQRAGDTA